jgi:hypothetical protein
MGPENRTVRKQRYSQSQADPIHAYAVDAVKNVNYRRKCV